MRPISASTSVSAPPRAVFDFLADLDNHWQLASRFVRVAEIDPAAPEDGRIVIHGPLGIKRPARTKITTATPPREIEGLAEVAGGTIARIAWRLEPSSAGTRVTLQTRVESPTHRDRLLLALGGRRWLRSVLRHTVGRLDEELARQRR
jgi:carbon monoxide dehydrogenase subunit G